jgi:hypothetical protein
MELWHLIWKLCVLYWPDFLLALVFAIVVDLLRIGSIIRDGVRRIKNKLAERSVAQLQKRIVDQERYRNMIAALYLESDKALYLHILGMVLAVLLLICVSAILFILGTLGLGPAGLEIMIVGFLAIAVVFAVYGLRLAALDTRPKVSEMITKLDAGIATLKAKLEARRC